MNGNGTYCSLQTCPGATATRVSLGRLPLATSLPFCVHVCCMVPCAYPKDRDGCSGCLLRIGCANWSLGSLGLRRQGIDVHFNVGQR